eukprot:CAMPEP_0172458756 /NCGR_PEP_ID=MMETSP1065-20121228/29099_1 /TAXON_ID=265537 /ORGANISM="Amphiprora paludosa, Strain CCMP125" /LENGTH=32 /DNA_ID= /DNA_START= /DNA_END= /DNA_ORIENTATION=
MIMNIVGLVGSSPPFFIRHYVSMIKLAIFMPT